MEKKDFLKNICKLIRYYIITSTTAAGSGHPTSSLSAVELMAVLFFKGFFKFRIDDPSYHNNDRLIFSKGHASPLFYSLWAVTGAVSEKELLGLRKFKSVLEGHPTPRFKYTEAATGSLGQGLSVGLGMALSAKKIDKLPYNTFVLLGDGEMAEGSQWEAMQIASYYELDNLIGIIDVNRLGQSGETMYGKDVYAYEKRISAFGWKTLVVEDGHNIDKIEDAFKNAAKRDGRPTMIIAGTVKGKGVKFIENKEGWHGKVMDNTQCTEALKELGPVDKTLIAKLELPENVVLKKPGHVTSDENAKYSMGDRISTREAYGDALASIADHLPELVVLDAEVSNSTYSGLIKKRHPDRFFEMFIAEQNMVGASLGMSLRGKVPFVSTFAAFFTRAFDQIRMSQYSNTNIKFCGSHAGVSIGPDGSSQMGLEDISMFRSLLDCVVLYPSDAVSTKAAVRAAGSYHGNVYIRTTRMETPVLYDDADNFKIGKSHILKSSSNDCLAIIAGGVTLHEVLKAYEELSAEGIFIKVVDLFSIKPIDSKTIIAISKECKAIITVEDHYPAGGIGEAVSSIESLSCPVHIMAVNEIPRSGKPEELLEYEEISKTAIINKVKEII